MSTQFNEEQYLHFKEFVSSKKISSKNLKKYSSVVGSLVEVVENKVKEYEFKKHKLSEYVELERKIENVAKTRDTAVALIQKNKWQFTDYHKTYLAELFSLT